MATISAVLRPDVDLVHEGASQSLLVAAAKGSSSISFSNIVWQIKKKAVTLSWYESFKTQGILLARALRNGQFHMAGSLGVQETLISMLHMILVKVETGKNTLG